MTKKTDPGPLYAPTLPSHPECWSDKSLIMYGIASGGKFPLRPRALTVLGRGPRMKAIFPSHTVQPCKAPWVFRWPQQRLCPADQHSHRQHHQPKECLGARKEVLNKNYNDSVSVHRKLTHRLATIQNYERLQSCIGRWVLRGIIDLILLIDR